MANGDSKRIVDGSFDFSGGVDSGRISTVRSQSNPHGLLRTQLAWLENGTVRGGGISPRPGMKSLVAGQKWSGIYQGGFMYEQVNGNPYLMLDIGGRTYQVRVDTDNSVKDVTGALTRSATQDQHWFCQAEEFLLIQDSLAEMRVWDGTTLRNVSSMGGVAPYLPIGTAMSYLNGRVTVASGGRQYLMGDIVNGPPNNNTSNVLHAAENVTYPGGGGFIVPSNAGNIRGISYTANINQPVSVGTLFIGTRKAIYAFNGSTQRFPNANGDGGWANTPNLVTVAQYGNGFVNDRSLVTYNGDLFYQTLEPGVRSLILAVRYFQQWGNTPISRNENRVLALTDRGLLRFSSGIEFNNRLYQTTLPFQIPGIGVAHRGIMPLDFDLISSLEDKLSNQIFPAWEGMQEGLDFLQLFQGDFGGLQRGFAVVHSRVTNQIEVWELTLGDLRDNGDNRITLNVESASYDGGDIRNLKDLETMRLWLDRVYGKVEIDVYFRPDQHSCYYYWHTFTECAARNCAEDPLNELPCVYPTQQYCTQERPSLTTPKPPVFCNSATGRPIHRGYQFQVKLIIKGSCRVRGILLYMLPVEEAPFDGLTCAAPTV